MYDQLRLQLQCADQWGISEIFPSLANFCYIPKTKVANFKIHWNLLVMLPVPLISSPAIWQASRYWSLLDISWLLILAGLPLLDISWLLILAGLLYWIYHDFWSWQASSIGYIMTSDLGRPPSIGYIMTSDLGRPLLLDISWLLILAGLPLLDISWLLILAGHFYWINHDFWSWQASRYWSLLDISWLLILVGLPLLDISWLLILAGLFYWIYIMTSDLGRPPSIGYISWLLILAGLLYWIYHDFWSWQASLYWIYIMTSDLGRPPLLDISWLLILAGLFYWIYIMTSDLGRPPSIGYISWLLILAGLLYWIYHDFWSCAIYAMTCYTFILCVTFFQGLSVSVFWYFLCIFIVALWLMQNAMNCMFIGCIMTT